MKRIVFFILSFAFILDVSAQNLPNSEKWVAKINNSYNKIQLEKVVKDSLIKCLRDVSVPRSQRVRNTNVNSLTYLYILCAKIETETDLECLPDTSSIYPFLKIDTTRLPYDAILYKKKKYWGNLHLYSGISDLEQIEDLDRNSRKRRSNLYEYILKQEPETIFYVDNFIGYFWYTKDNKIFVYRPSWGDITEADTFIHNYHKKEK